MSTYSRHSKAVQAPARSLRALVPFILRYRRRLVLALGALLLATAALLALPVAIRFVIDAGIGGDDAAGVDRWFALLFAVAGVFGVTAALRYYLVSWLGERVVADIRERVYRKVIRLDPAFFETTQTGEVLSRLTTDTTLIQSIAGVGISIALRSALQLIGGLAMLIVTSPGLAGVIVLLVPIVVVPVLYIARRVRSLSRTSQDRVADSSGLAGEILNATSVVQAFTLEELQSRRYADSVETAFETAAQRIRVRAVLTAVAILLGFGAITLVLWLGAHAVLAGEMTMGELSQFLLYSLLVGSATVGVSEMWGEFQRAAGAAERLIELLHAEPAIVAPADPVALPEPARGAIRFETVSFSYPSRPGTRALDDFELDIAPGETVAFVGPSGAGKSTVFQLLLRFYDPAAGCIRMDGVDIASTDPAAVRTRIALVPQDTVIFGATAWENIGYGRPSASRAEIEAAADAAAAGDFIRALPDGFDTFLGERGTRLSGGQRQRIAIARAVLKDPPILLLDEATSSLDSESELLIQRALADLMRERTTLVIAHRLATIQKADRIVVMDGGRIVDIGHHHELVARDPLYARLAALQFGEIVSMSDEEPDRRGVVWR